MTHSDDMQLIKEEKKGRVGKRTRKNRAISGWRPVRVKASIVKQGGGGKLTERVDRAGRLVWKSEGEQEALRTYGAGRDPLIQ